MSPTQRTLQNLRSQGYTVQVVERWNSFARKRIDLYGCIDLVACGQGSILGVQATSWSNHAARRNKSIAEPRLYDWLASGGRFEVWSWKGRKCRKEALTLDMLPKPAGVKLVFDN